MHNGPSSTLPAIHECPDSPERNLPSLVKQASPAPDGARPYFASRVDLSVGGIPAANGCMRRRRVAVKTISRCTRGLMILLCVIAAWSFAWPVYRAFLKIEIDNNEGWNAYFADAAMGRMPLYPSPGELITNNYPPLSFLFVGMAGRCLNDTVLAGRLTSLASVLAIAVAVALVVRSLGGSQNGSLVAGLFFVATMCRFYTSYVGMNDPQLLAQAVMIFGFWQFIRSLAVKKEAGLLPANKPDTGLALAILLMVFAGFIKHNIIAMPVAAFLCLFWRSPRQAVKYFSIAMAALALGFGVCYVCFGRDFFTNLLFSRQYSWKEAFASIGEIKPLNVAFFASLFILWNRRRDAGVQLCGLLIAISFFSYLLQKTGAGVDVNAAFDLTIGVSVGVGLAFSHAPVHSFSQITFKEPDASDPALGVASFLKRHQAWFAGDLVRMLLLAALCIRLLPSRTLVSQKAVRLVFDPGFASEIAMREAAMAHSVDRVRNACGNVMCSSDLVSYWAGKPFAVDRFNAFQRMSTGALPRDAVKTRIERNLLVDLPADPRAQWRRPMNAKLPVGWD